MVDAALALQTTISDLGQKLQRSRASRRETILAELNMAVERVDQVSNTYLQEWFQASWNRLTWQI